MRARYTPEEDSVLREHYASRGPTWIARSGLIRDIWDERSVKSRGGLLGLGVVGRLTRRTDHVSTLEQFKLRCTVNEDGCWTYCGTGSSAKSGVWMPAGKFGDGKPAVARPAAAAWLLAGNKLSRRWCVWPRSEDCLRTCCNPAHLRSGSRGQHTKIATAASADLRAINLAVASARGNQAKAAPVEKVREAEALFDAGATIHAVVAATGICKTTASKIRAGKHMFSRGRAGHMAANSSIFAFARAA